MRRGHRHLPAGHTSPGCPAGPPVAGRVAPGLWQSSDVGGPWRGGARGAAEVLVPRTVLRRDPLTQSDSPAEAEKPREQGRGDLRRTSPSWPLGGGGAGTLSWDHTGRGLLVLFTL